MARTVTLAQLRTRARRRADMVTTQFVSDAEVTDVVNDELCELYDLLVSVAPPDYYAAEATITTSSGVIPYTLEGDFRSLITVYASEGDGRRRPILPITEYQRSRFMAPQGAYDVVVLYVPTAPVLELDNDTFDGVSGWDALITARVARRLLQKRKTETSSLDAEINAKTQEIRSSARRDIGNARRITDVDDAEPYFYRTSNVLTGYKLMGDNLELYQSAIWVP